MVFVDLEFLFSRSTSANSWDIELKTRRETLCLRPPCIIHKLSWIQKWRLTIYPDGMHNWSLALEIKHQHFKCPCVLLFLCRMFCYHYYSCFVINTSSIVKDIIIIMTVILVNMFIIISIVVQNWSAEKFK